MGSSENLKNCIRIISTIAAAAMVLVSVVVYHANFARMAVFLLYILFYVQIPGLLICRTLRIKTGHYSSDLMLGFFSGWTLTVGMYFLSEAFGSDILLIAAGPALSAAWIILAVRDRSAIDRLRGFSPFRIPAAFFVFIVLMMAFVMLTTQYLYMSPEFASRTYVSMDKSYEMGLISQLSQGFPLKNPWVSGRIVHYHIFTQILLAVPVRLFGLTPDFAVMTCGPLLTVWSLGLSTYAMFRYFSRRPERAGLYSLSVILAHMFVAREPYASYMFRILLTNENFAGHAVACAAAWVILLDVYMKSDESRAIRAARCILLAAVMMLLTGIKAPVGLVMTGALIGTAVLAAILRKADLRIIPAVILSFIGFFIVYKLILGSGGTSGIGGESIIGFGDVIGLSFWKAGLIDIMNRAGFPYILRLAVVFMVFAVFFFSIYLVPFVIGYIRELVLVLKGDREYDIAKVTVYAAAFVGFFLMMILSYYGHSQIYFGTVTVMFAPLIAFWFLEDTESGSARWMRGLRRFSYICFIVVLAASSIVLAWHYTTIIPAAVKRADAKAKYNKYMSLSSKEYDAVNWIHDNLDEDSLIATQMFASVSYDDYNIERRWDSVHFLYAAYSGRRFYLEGSGYTFEYAELETKAEMEMNERQLFDPENAERGELARSLGVTHVMVTKKIHPVGDLSSDDYILIFSNSDIDLYRVAD
ncbi:MAG: hypothetical protein IKF42_02880 [Mogibacterium sp.]|nr:hypothetical protein [Mogibacterium sp.]